MTTPPLIAAVQSGDMRQVQAFLDDNPHMAFPPGLIEEAVSIALGADNADLVTLLLDVQTQRTALAQAASAHTAAQSSDPQQAFFNAVWSNDLPTIRSLLSTTSALLNEARGDQGESALHLAVFYGRSDVVKALLAYDPDMSATDSRGDTASDISRQSLPKGISQDDRAACALLLEQHLATAGSAASSAMSSDEQAFLLAIEEGSNGEDADDIRTLLSKNPQLIQARNAEDQSALFLAVARDDEPLVSMLLEHIAGSLVLDVEDKEQMLSEVLGLQASNSVNLVRGDFERQALTVSMEAPSTAPALTAAEGNAALYEAAPSGDLTVFDQIGPDVYAALCDNRTNPHTVFEIAAEATASNVDFLHGLAMHMLEAPSDASIELMVAVYQNSPEAIESACAKGADIRLTDKAGNSLLMVAAYMNHTDCISKLLDLSKAGP